MDKIVFVFNKFYTCLIKDVKKNTSDAIKSKIKTHYKAIDKMSHDYVKFFLLSFNSEDINTCEILKELKISDLMLELKTDNDKELFWNYVYILASLALVYKEGINATDNDKVEADASVGVLINTVLEILTKKQKGMDVTDDIASVLQDDIQAMLLKIKEVKLDGTTKQEADNAVGDNPFMNMFKGMEGSKICDLAQEISADIDVSNLKIDSSEDIMKMLDFSSSNNIMGDIIKKVSSKMHEKISSGELKQEDLFGEAISMMGKFSQGGTKGGMGDLGGLGNLFNNPMMAEMMKMATKGKAKPNPEVFKTASSRDRLKKKLDERRKAAEKK